MKRRKLAGALLVVLLATAPSVLIARSAGAEPDDDDSTNGSAQPSDEPAAAASAAKGAKSSAKRGLKNDTPAMSAADLAKRRREVLEAMSHDDTVLINVSHREMPASPDVLDLGRKGARALARCVSDNVDDDLRMHCANMLGRIGDKSALPSLQGALEAWSADVRGAAIRAIRKMPDRSSTAPLLRVLDRADEDTNNRAAAFEALGIMSDPKAIRALERGLRADSEQANVRTAAFRGLWKSRHLVGRQQLIGDVGFALTSDVEALTLAATFAASELRAPELAAPLMRLIQSTDVRIRNRAVYALGKIGSRASTKALISQLPKVRESRMLNNMAFALERLDPNAFYGAAGDLVTHKQAQIRMNAAFVLGDVRRPEGLPLLEKALSDSNHLVRLSAVTAIGKLDAPEGSKLLEPFVDDADPALSRAAIYGLYSLSGYHRADLVFDRLYANPKKPSEREGAALALALAKDHRVDADLIACLEVGACRVADVEPTLASSSSPDVPGRTLLAWVKGRNDLTSLVAGLRPPGSAVLAVSSAQAEIARGSFAHAQAALDLAGDLGDAKTLAPLTPLLTHHDARLRFHAAVALSRVMGNDDAANVIFAELDNMPHDRLGHAASTLARVKEPPIRAKLLPRILERAKGADPNVALAMASVHLAWDPETGFFRMLEALGSPARVDRDLAERYLIADSQPIVTELLRRALARDGRDIVQGHLRRILDLKANTKAPSF